MVCNPRAFPFCWQPAVGQSGSSFLITTVAGNGTVGYSGDGGPATSATLHSPGPVAVDSFGNLYIGDLNNLRVRKVTQQGSSARWLETEAKVPPVMAALLQALHFGLL
jgi:hypothetical protein